MVVVLYNLYAQGHQVRWSDVRMYLAYPKDVLGP